MDAKDEIRSRLPIEQLVAQYCQLKKKGRNFVALCPFHQDKNPSLLVSPDKGLAYCFACQSGGDIFSFYQKIESVDFPEAVRQLAEKVGVKIEKVSRTTGVSRDAKERMKECLQAAEKFYRSSLVTHPHAKAYVEERGVPQELIDTFGIGYAPDSFSVTYDHLLKEGFSRSEIVASGLGVQRELTEEKIYDRFRHRIMFPIRDSQGTVIGFGGRAMGDSDAKYVNSPESPLYHKSSVLFGLFEAKEAIRKKKTVVLVEGYFDCIASRKAGVENVVAVSGTALTAEHAKILRRYAETVVLCLDSDSAGELAAARAFGILASAGFTILSVTLSAKDPDELTQKDPALFRRLIETTATPYVSSVVDRLHSRDDLRTPTGKRAIAEVLFPLLAAIPSSVELRSTLEHAASAFGMVRSELESDFRSWQESEKVLAERIDKHIADAPYGRIELSVAVAMAYPAVRPILRELIVDEDDPHAPFVQAALALSADTDVGVAPIDPVIRERLGLLALFAEENFHSWNDSLAARELKKLIAHANRDAVKRKQLEVVAALREARREGKSDDETRLLSQYQKLLTLSKMAER